MLFSLCHFERREVTERIDRLESAIAMSLAGSLWILRFAQNDSEAES